MGLFRKKQEPISFPRTVTPHVRRELRHYSKNELIAMIWEQQKIILTLQQRSK
jgi:hypothetical protein